MRGFLDNVASCAYVSSDCNHEDLLYFGGWLLHLFEVAKNLFKKGSFKSHGLDKTDIKREMSETNIYMRWFWQFRGSL